MILTKEIAYKSLQDFFNEKPMVLFGTGTSCALDKRFGMLALQDRLSSEMPKQCISTTEKENWDTVTNEITKGKDLESALNTVQDEKLIKLIIKITSDFISAVDKEYSLKILTGDAEWPALNLFKKMIDGLQGALHVATPNYDLLAEYAFEKAHIPYITGFSGGVCRYLDWEQCERRVTCWQNIPIKRTMKKVEKTMKHIQLYKVHGSLNTFKVGNDIVENNAWIVDPPDIVERVIITPGILKHKQLHQNRDDLLGMYDKAVKKHCRFLFIGFGFNDSQLNNDSLMRKLKEQKCPGLIITKESNERIVNLIHECDNLWLVCKHPDALNKGTQVFNRKFDDWLLLADKKLWDTGEFTKDILGG